MRKWQRRSRILVRRSDSRCRCVCRHICHDRGHCPGSFASRGFVVRTPLSNTARQRLQMRQKLQSNRSIIPPIRPYNSIKHLSVLIPTSRPTELGHLGGCKHCRFRPNRCNRPDVPWLECPACNALTWVITVTE